MKPQTLTTSHIGIGRRDLPVPWALLAIATLALQISLQSWAWLCTWDTTVLRPGGGRHDRSRGAAKSRNGALVIATRVKAGGKAVDTSPKDEEYRTFLLTGKRPSRSRFSARLSGRLRKPRPGFQTAAKQAEGRRLIGVAITSGLIGLALGRLKSQDEQYPQDGDSDIPQSQLIDMLQGQWEDEISITIRISGRRAVFSDDPSREYAIEDGGGEGLILRDARLIELTGSDEDGALGALWRFPWGQQHQWERLTRDNFGDKEWDDAFREYKGARLKVWRDLARATADGSSASQKIWREGGPFPSSPLALIFRSRLLAGAELVPGVCFTHRVFGYRGVIVGHDSKCVARASWKRDMGVDKIPGGEQQPYYHCIVDERDWPGGDMTYVAEANIVPEFSARAFPIQSDLVQASLTKCDAVYGYLPRQRLMHLLDEQTEQGGRFMM